MNIKWECYVLQVELIQSMTESGFQQCVWKSGSSAPTISGSRTRRWASVLTDTRETAKHPPPLLLLLVVHREHYSHVSYSWYTMYINDLPSRVPAIERLFSDDCLSYIQVPPHDKHNGMCAHRRLRSAWASAQSDQSLCYPHEERLGP